MLTGSHSVWLEIDLSAVRHNIQQIQSLAHRPIMAVIKANGYGHGLVEMGRTAVSAGAAWLAVARIEEALALRQGGVSAPVLVLGFCLPERVPEAIANQISLSVSSPELAREFAEQARAAGEPLSVHAKFDTGMGRLGVFPEEGVPFIRFIQESPHLCLQGMFTHMARADEPESETTGWQLDRFTRLVSAVEEQGMRPALVHAANSASILHFPKAYFDIVRPGIAIYGLHPDRLSPLPEGYHPALTWKARLASVKELPAGHGVGYNYRYVIQRMQPVGVIPVGYADGFRRRLGNSVLLGGKRVPIIGGVCMDQCMLGLEEVPDARVGDEVVLLGRQGDVSITAEEIAQDWGTNNYEVVCGLSTRVPRIYIG